MVQEGDKFLLQLEDNSLLALPTGLNVTEGQNVVYAIRPEQVNVVDETHCASALKATITAIENTGSDMQLFAARAGPLYLCI